MSLLLSAGAPVAQGADRDTDPSPGGLLAGKMVLVVGDSHLAHKQHLIDTLERALKAKGARVAAFGACGATPSEFLQPSKTDCGRASQRPGSELLVEEGTQAVWSMPQLIREYRPDQVVLVIGDTLGAYRQKTFPKSWVWDEVTALTAALKQSQQSCTWVGPPWGRSGGAYGKTAERVAVLSNYLNEIVAPCRYLDSTQFAKPGQWGSYDGQHLDLASYKAWAAAITQALSSVHEKGPIRASTADEDDPWLRR